MSRTRLIVSTIFFVLVGLLAATSLWAGTLKPASPATVATAVAISSNAQGVMLMDVDGDGKVDLVVVEPTSATACGPNMTSQVEVFLGNGSGGFGAATAVTIPCGAGNKNPGSAALAHGQLLGGAAHPDDIVVASPGTGDITVLANTSTTGTVNLAPTTNSPYALPVGANPQGLAVADVDGDGNQDIIVADQAKDQLELLLGNSGTAATFSVTTTTASLAAGAAPVAVLAVATFGSAHGCPATCTTSTVDLATANSGNTSASILTNTTAATGSPTFSVANKTVGTSPVAIAAGILRTTLAPPVVPDLAVANNGSANVSVLLNNGSGVFGSASNVTLVGSSPKGVAIGDFNADTNNDIVVADSSGAEILFNNGSGSLATSAAVPPVSAGTAPAGIASAVPASQGGAGDLNGDSFADVAVADTGANTVTILLGTPFFNVQKPAIPNQVEGVSSGPIDLLTFHYDLSTPTLAADVTNWGDGQSTLGVAPTFNAGTSTYTVTSSHTYAEQNAAGETISITVTDSSVSPNPTLTTTTSIAAVNDGVLTASNPPDLPSAATIPHTYSSVLVANFTDQNTGAPLTDFTSTIDWDDCGGGVPGTTQGTCAPGNLDATGVVGGGGGSYTITATHTYNKGGFFTITTVITDAEGGGVQKTIPGAVTHANLSTLTVTPVAVAGTEGAQLTDPTVLANITTTDATPSLSAQVDFNCPTAPSGCTLSGTNISVVANGVSGCASQFCVITTGTTHTYADEGSFNIFVKVTDAGDGSTGTTTSVSTIGDAPLNVLAATALSNQEGTGTFTGVIAGKFHDANTAAPATDFTATINWGDGNTDTNCKSSGGNPNCSVASLGGGDFKVVGNHPYANSEETDTYQIRFTVQDVGGSQITLPAACPGAATEGCGAAVSFTDAPLTTLATAALSNQEGTGTFNGATVAKFHDAYTGAPAADFTARIDWGDGAMDTNCNSSGGNPNCSISSLGGGDFAITGNHTYANNEETDTYQIHYSVFDVGSPNVGDPGRIGNPELPAPTALGAAVSFFDAPLTPVPVAISGSQGLPLPAGTIIASFTDGFTAAPLSDFTPNAANKGVLSINWGDGTPVQNGVGSIVANGTSGCPVQPGLFCVLAPAGTHTYASNGTYTVSVQVKDVGSATTTINSTVTVAAGVLTDIPMNQQFPVSNVLTGIQVAHFQNTNPGALPSQFTATINWGDGNVTAGTVIAGACPESTDAAPCDPLQSQFDVTGSHTYLLASTTFTVTVTIVPQAGNTITATTLIFIPNVVISQFNELISPPSSQIQVGTSVDLLVTLVPTPGYPNPVQLSCSGYDFNTKTLIPLAPGINCAFLPSNTVPDVMQTRQIHAIVSTTAAAPGVARQMAPLGPGGRGPAQLALLLPIFFGTFGIVLLAPMSRREKRRALLGLGAGLVLLALFLVGCGGTPVNVGPSGSVTPPGTYGVAVTTNVQSSPGNFVQAVATVTVTK